MRRVALCAAMAVAALAAIGAMTAGDAAAAEACVTCYQELNFMGGGSVWCGEYGEPGGGQPARTCTVSEVCDEWYCAPEECCLHCQWEGQCGGSLAAAPVVSPAGRYVPTPQYRSAFVDGRLLQGCSGYVIHDSSPRLNGEQHSVRIVI